MQFIINSTDDEIKRVHEKMTSVGSPKWRKPKMGRHAADP